MNTRKYKTPILTCGQSSIAMRALLIFISSSLLLSVSSFTTYSSGSLVSLTHRTQYRPTYATHNEALFSTTSDDAGANLNEKNLVNGVDNEKAEHAPNLIQIYLNYMTKLWRQTSTDERKKIAAAQAVTAIRRVKHIMEGEEYVDLANAHKGDTLEETDTRSGARDELLNACNTMLESIENEKEKKEKAVEAVLKSDDGNTAIEASTSNGAKPKKKSRSVLFGAAMGAIVAGWVFSGNIVFTTAFTAMTLLGQLEYYRMVMRTGVYPARKISVVGACAMFITALFAPNLHQICLPVFATYAMMWFLTMRRTVVTIPEIATTFTGMFYLGYIPSFWVRIRMIGTRVLDVPLHETTRLGPVLAPIIQPILGKMKDMGIMSPITTGSVFIFWTWISIAFSDVGGYFFGRRFGKTKLGKIAPAVGAASPNKTLEGFMGGSLFSACLGALGAWVMRWPYWYLTGPVHGILLAFLGLVGDLTASMLKRDSGLKDFGDLLPDHGGVMDRVDSFVFTAPYSWLMIQVFIPYLKSKSSMGIAIP
uniref:Phosphatidate cytidylyltransferase n=1 Tax=Chaetoceros debilis TaxID=122233 RepID=A0A7S3V3Z9_9STRA|mmetsp:Transcript_26334/g.40244  ORF Transcript_26334/g.40244 Transcript_26334/m.40244 type:complete len:535 (+) Transcript_26334:164-1768(+)